jgi:hypothetical protein
MPGEHEPGGRPRIRRIDAARWCAELDLDALVVTVFETKDDHVVGVIGRGRWGPLPPPLDRFRGRVVSDELDDHTCDMLERALCRGTKTWTFGHGPWADAEREAIAAGIGEYDARLLRKLMWSFYRGRWPLKFTSGCGFGPEGVAPLIAAALADPQRLRARWEVLLRTGGLCWPPAEGDLEEVRDDGDPWDDFYTEP